ncbi:MAG: type II secretion system F family protein, partial [Planctomycetales bacterium]|nr:type II secretion system F family protein [Planctomycetales bacterium]
RVSGKRIPKRSLLMIVTQLSIMTRSGVDLADAVRSIAVRATNPLVRDSLSSVHASLEAGLPLFKALAEQGDRYDAVMTSSVAAGEASGRLSEVLSNLATLMRDDIRTQSSIRSAVSYPLVLTLVTFGVLTAMIFFVLPQFRGIYETSRAPTPVVTQMLLDMSVVLRKYWWVVVGLVALMGASLMQLLRSTEGRRWLDRLWFRVPLLGSVCRFLFSGRLFRLQGVLLESGVPLLEVLQLTQKVFKNAVVVEMNQRMQEAVLQGREMSSALAGATCVPEGALEMVATAEANGQLAGVLETVGEFFESEGEQQLKEFMKIAEPAIIVVMGVIVGAIVMAVMLPMLDLSSAGSM